MKRKLCIFCEIWRSGGIESFVYSLLTHIDTSSFDIDIVASEIGESVFKDELKNKGIGFIELSGNRRQFIKNLFLFFKLIKAKKYDIIHANLFQGASLAFVELSRRAGIPVRIAHSHNTSLRKSRFVFLKKAVHTISTYVFKNAPTDRWACSEDAARFMFRLRKSDKAFFRFIPNGIDLEAFRFRESIREITRNEFNLNGRTVIGSIGRLTSQKNYTFLIEAFAELIKQSPEAILLIIGDGEEREALYSSVRRLGIESATIFFGETDRVPELLDCMDVFVFPSLFEGLGIAVIEAQASGLPVLCSENVPKEACLLNTVERLPLDLGAKAWAETISRLLSVSVQREECADLVGEKGFDIKSVSKQIEEFYFG